MDFSITSELAADAKRVEVFVVYLLLVFTSLHAKQESLAKLRRLQKHSI